MKKIGYIFFILQFCFQITFSQKPWFQFYTDSVSISTDANEIARLFGNDVQTIYPVLKYNPVVRLKTTPLLIFYGIDRVSYYPLWNELDETLQKWFYEIGGNETEGKKIFALFFNGFYLPHELSHGFEEAMNNLNQSYQNEYFANTAAILWWKKHGYHNELLECYNYSKKILAQTPNPVPDGQTMEEFFTKNYFAILESGNPYIYGYMQFNQFVKIYEDTSLPDFDEFLKSYSVKK